MFSECNTSSILFSVPDNIYYAIFSVITGLLFFTSFIESLRFIFTFKFDVYVCKNRPHVCKCLRDKKRVSGPKELELWRVVSCQTWVLEIELGLSIVVL